MAREWDGGQEGELTKAQPALRRERGEEGRGCWWVMLSSSSSSVRWLSNRRRGSRTKWGEGKPLRTTNDNNKVERGEQSTRVKQVQNRSKQAVSRTRIDCHSHLHAFPQQPLLFLFLPLALCSRFAGSQERQTLETSPTYRHGSVPRPKSSLRAELNRTRAYTFVLIV